MRAVAEELAKNQARMLEIAIIAGIEE